MSKLKIAVQKSGRLNEGSMKLLKNCGIRIENGLDQLKASASNFPIEILFLRNGDIPQYVEDGVADVAIIGENLLIETGADLTIRQRLNFSKCRLSLAIPRSDNYESLDYFQGKRIATSYPATLEKYLQKNNINAEIHKISGSVEIAPNIGLAEAACDIVSSGSTLFKNGLTEVETILKSEACLVASNTLDEEQEAILSKLLFRIQSVLKAKSSKYILLNAPKDKVEQISRILPVLKSPTVLPLSDPDWCSIHSVIDEDRFWEVIDELKAAGAEGILVVPIEKMVI